MKRYAALLILIFSGCSWHVGTVPEVDHRYFNGRGVGHEFTEPEKKWDYRYLDKVPVETAQEASQAYYDTKQLRKSLQRICNGGWNPGRQMAICYQLDDFGVPYHTEFIDFWIPLQRNIIVDIEGNGPNKDKIVYLLAHSDKSDAALWGNMGGQLTCGLIDTLFSWSYMSDGAFDNGCSSAVLLQLAKWLHENRHKLNKSYRLIWVGGEEVGLRGTKCYVSSLSWKSYDKIDFVLNMDGAGHDTQLGLLCDDWLYDRLKHKFVEVADKANMSYSRVKYPALAASDHMVFEGSGFPINMLMGLVFHGYPGAIMPRRDWFSLHKWYKPNFMITSCGPKLNWGEAMFLNIIALPFSQIHGHRDNCEYITPRDMWKCYRFVQKIIEHTDNTTAEEMIKYYEENEREVKRQTSQTILKIKRKMND